MGGLQRLGAAVAATVILLAPAIWNAFPLLQYDTGGYVARWFEGYLVPSRSNAYGLFVALTAPTNFWLAIVAQAAATVWVLALLLRATGFGRRPLLLVGVTAALAIFTGLPWLTSILLTDAFIGIAVLALHLLIFAGEHLHRVERVGLVGVAAFSVATHSATFAVALALVVIAAIAALFTRKASIAGAGRGAAALVLGAALLLAANFATSGRIAWTPGGYAIPFGRMLQDGIVAQYLSDHCPDVKLVLCGHQHELPGNADNFFWGQDLFDRLGRFRALDPEMRTIVIESVKAYPMLQLKTAIAASWRQLLLVSTGEGIENVIWHTYAIIEKFTPGAVPAMRAARQQRGELSFTTINRLHVPIALAAMLLLVPVMLLGLRSQRFADLGRLAATTSIALAANAVVCGVLSNPHDRYGARIAWLAPLVILLVALRAAESVRRTTSAAQIPDLDGAVPAALQVPVRGHPRE